MDYRKPLEQSISSPHIKNAIDYTLKHLHQELSLARICKHLNLNKAYFCKLFKDNLGVNYSTYVNQLRVEQGKKLLLETNWSILDIALYLGYNNPNYFIKSFKTQSGTTPLKYRKQNQALMLQMAGTQNLTESAK